MRGIKPDWISEQRQRCKNCPKFFYARRPEQKFCSNLCRKQFHRNRGAYATLKALVPGMIRAALRDELTAHQERITQLEKQLQQISTGRGRKKIA